MTSLESRIMEVDVGKVLDRPPTEQRGLGLSACTAPVVGNMIGSGIFLLPASLAAFGPISLVGWVVTSLGALVLAIIFGRLSR